MSADVDEATDPAPPRRPDRHGGTPWYATPFLVIAAVTALAAGLRFYHLSLPRTYVFDEIYYAKDGCFDAGFNYRRCGLESPGEQTSTVHPPLGRWIIAGGEAAFGNRSFGWRFASAVAGTLSVTLLSILAWRLFGSVLWGGVAGLLLATENLNFVQSRISMLDIFVTAFVVMGFLFLVLDREWVYRRTAAPATPATDPPAGSARLRPAADVGHPTFPRDDDADFPLPPDRVPSPIARPWRIAAGLAFGAALASKWSGGLGLVAGLLLSLFWERTRRSVAGLRGPLLEALRDEGFGLFVFLVLLPLAVYLGSYGRFWADSLPHGVASTISAWWSNQAGMATYSIHLRATHPYASHAWTWILLKRPVAYYYVCHRMSGAVCARPAEILAVGNPLIFWSSVFTIPYAAVAWGRRRDWRAGLIVTAFLVQYLPWFGAARTSFVFYLAPVTPFMVLAGTYAIRAISNPRSDVRLSPVRVGVASFLIATSIASFVFFLPVLTAKTTTYDQWRVRMWYGRCSPKPTWCWI
jgi:dolichyl-phosphate-mannose-protein mannosyltransferase